MSGDYHMLHALRGADYADWIRKDGLQAGRDGPVVSSEWTDKMVEVAQYIETLEARLVEAMKLFEDIRAFVGQDVDGSSRGDMLDVEIAINEWRRAASEALRPPE